MADKRIELGAIIGALGVKGEVIIKPFGQDPLTINSYGQLQNENASRTFTLTAVKPHKKGLSARIKEITSRNEAEGLKGTVLFAERNQLPEPESDEFYYTDLIGLEARSDNGEIIGEITSIDNYGAGDVIEILPQNSQSTMHLSFTKENVPEVNIIEGYIVVIPPVFDKDET